MLSGLPVHGRGKRLRLGMHCGREQTVATAGGADDGYVACMGHRRMDTLPFGNGACRPGQARGHGGLEQGCRGGPFARGCTATGDRPPPISPGHAEQRSLLRLGHLPDARNQSGWQLGAEAAPGRGLQRRNRTKQTGSAASQPAVGAGHRCAPSRAVAAHRPKEESRTYSTRMGRPGLGSRTQAPPTGCARDVARAASFRASDSCHDSLCSSPNLPDIWGRANKHSGTAAPAQAECASPWARLLPAGDSARSALLLCERPQRFGHPWGPVPRRRLKRQPPKWSFRCRRLLPQAVPRQRTAWLGAHRLLLRRHSWA